MLFERAYAAFERGALSELVYDAKAVEDRAPLADAASEAERNLVAVYAGLVRGLRPGVHLPAAVADSDAGADAYLAAKVGWALSAQTAFQARAARDLLCALVNKHAGALPALPAQLDALWARVADADADADADIAQREAALLAYFHVSPPRPPAPLRSLTADHQGARAPAPRARVPCRGARARAARGRRRARARRRARVRRPRGEPRQEAPRTPDRQGAPECTPTGPHACTGARVHGWC